MLRMSKMADYAVVVLAELARDPGRLKTAAGLSQGAGLPVPTVSKVLKALTKAGLVDSSRGISGGYVLRARPAEISVADIIAAIDGPVVFASCVDGGGGNCAMEDRCVMRGCWDEVNNAIGGVLRTVTLAAMLEKQRPGVSAAGSEGQAHA